VYPLGVEESIKEISDLRLQIADFGLGIETARGGMGVKRWMASRTAVPASAPRAPDGWEKWIERASGPLLGGLARKS
jgi:hypothetical protein